VKHTRSGLPPMVLYKIIVFTIHYIRNSTVSNNWSRWKYGYK